MKISKWITSLIFLGISSISFANEYFWTSAVPTQVHIVPEGLVVIGSFSDEGITCSTASGSIFLPKTDDNFDHKLSMALMAYAAGKQVEVLVYKGTSSDCQVISAGGSIPKVHNYYWRLKN